MASVFAFDNSYARLPEAFYAQLAPIPVAAPHLLLFNGELAGALGLDSKLLSGEQGTAIFAGNRLPEGASPLAQAYAGHQFGHFTMLGDGRAILLGEHLMADGRRFDIQLKGSGRTPFSRSGDGRAALAPMLREYIISEAMYALGIPTTRSLAVVASGETIMREKPLPGAILTRVASSHLRVGTFEYIARLNNPAFLKMLADYAIQRHYPKCAEAANPYLALLQAVAERQALLLAQWMCVGFVHGVMNTDNMTLSGETIDYGPCAFMDYYHPLTVFSSIDRQGRYAYASQPPVAQWNLARFAEALLPLLDTDSEKGIARAEELLRAFHERYQFYWLQGMRAKLGLFGAEAEDMHLIQGLLDWMQKNRADFTNTFRALAMENSPSLEDADFAAWHTIWHQRLARQVEPKSEVLRQMGAANPAVIARNHLVEEALDAAVAGDLTAIQKLLDVLAAPYETPKDARYAAPLDTETPYRTYCGT
ncbi:MAG: YdiU family protein [Pseudomonadota bacterium]